MPNARPSLRSLPRRALGLAALAAGLAACTPAAPPSGLAERSVAAPAIEAASMNRFTPARATPPQRSNAEIAADFLALSFAMESGRPITRMTRFEGPVTIAVVVPMTGSAV